MAQVKADAHAQINSRRDTLEAAGFSYLSKMFNSDQRSVHASASPHWQRKPPLRADSHSRSTGRCRITAG
ncbi:hypothetical protein SQ11_12245 [Nitrosospira sp. NpAV]|nr:hypothetical protein SQ11_12245 [Nitrosospira sp. NpAV]